MILQQSLLCHLLKDDAHDLHHRFRNRRTDRVSPDTRPLVTNLTCLVHRVSEVTSRTSRCREPVGFHRLHGLCHPVDGSRHGKGMKPSQRPTDGWLVPRDASIPERPDPRGVRLHRCPKAPLRRPRRNATCIYAFPNFFAWRVSRRAIEDARRPYAQLLAERLGHPLRGLASIWDARKFGEKGGV